MDEVAADESRSSGDKERLAVDLSLFAPGLFSLSN
jgi:hypothetical protein